MSECKSLVKVPEDCTPENFDRLIKLGYLNEYEKLVEKCYVDSMYINQLIDCFNYIVILLDDSVRWFTNGDTDK